jgi:aryl-alcohol dehydrogenase-like predicted oxidoreductase
MTLTPSGHSGHNFILGCGTFGGIGGSQRLVGLGLDERSAFAAMDEAVDLGATVFDTAESYANGASESMIGRWLTERGPQIADGVRVVTKVAPADAGAFDVAFLERKFSGSLERLGRADVEGLLTHAPDDHTPIERTLEGLEAIRASGRCRYVGACNVDATQLLTALDAAERLGFAPYEVVQNGYSLLAPDADGSVRAICAERGIAYTPFSPLAGGALTGKYARGVSPPAQSRLALRPDGVDELLTPAAFDAIERLREAAQNRYDVACGALALAWLRHHPEIGAVVIGPSRQAPHLELAAQSARVVLGDADAAEIAGWFASAAAGR